MAHSVCYYKVGNLEFKIVGGNLFEDFLRKMDIRRFAFNYHNGLTEAVMDKNIGPFLQCIMPEFHFNTHKTQRIFSLIIQVADEMLPNPLLRCEPDKSSPQEIKDHFFTLFLSDSK